MSTEQPTEFRSLMLSISGEFAVPIAVRKIRITEGHYSPLGETERTFHFEVQIYADSEDDANEKMAALRKALADAIGGAPH